MFSDQIRSLRQKNGLSQVDLASLVGVTQSAVANWERGYRMPDIETIKAISEHFSVTVDSLIEGNCGKSFSGDNTLPVLSGVSDGEPVFTSRNFTLRFADFVMKSDDDSMADAGISLGDTVFVRRSDKIENGQIAVLSIGNSIVIRRVYCTNGRITLVSGNKSFIPAVFENDEVNDLKILGVVTSVFSKIK